MDYKGEKQGDKKFKKGEDAVTTGIFQWSKDYASGAHNFQEAVKCYRAAKCHKKALKALKQLIVCNESMHDNWAVARNYEQMLDIYMKEFPETSSEELKQIANKGFSFFRMADSIDKGIAMVSGLAKDMIKKGNFKEGVEYLKQAYTASMEDEKSFKKEELFNNIVMAYLENDIFFEVERMQRDRILNHTARDPKQSGLILLVMILAQHEAARAEKEMYELSNHIPDFLESDECEAADQLIKAYKKGDNDKFLKWTTKPAVTCLFPVIIINKLREIKVPAAMAGGDLEGSGPGLVEGSQSDSKKEAIQKLLF